MRLRTGRERAITLGIILDVSPVTARKLLRNAYGRHRSRRPQLVDDKPPPF